MSDKINGVTMSIKVTSRRIGDKDLDATIAEAMSGLREKILKLLHYAGELCVNDARLNGSYTDHTRNLRGSTGYGVVADGQLVDIGGFTQIKDGSEGPKSGINLLESVAATVGTGGYALILVAGMHYASYVADKGYNVLQSAEVLADKLVLQYLQRLNEEVAL